MTGHEGYLSRIADALQGLNAQCWTRCVGEARKPVRGDGGHISAPDRKDQEQEGSPQKACHALYSYEGVQVWEPSPQEAILLDGHLFLQYTCRRDRDQVREMHIPLDMHEPLGSR